MSKIKLSIIVPCYNDIETVGTLIERVEGIRLPYGWKKELILIDDHSTDGTKEVVLRHQKKYPSTIIIIQEKNMGKGNCLRKAIPFCKGEFIAFQDDDLEYEPEDLIKMIKIITSEKLDAVFGSRLLGKKDYHIYKINKIAVCMLSTLTNILFGSSYTDVATNYKMVRSDLLKAIPLKSNRFSIDFELSAKLAQRTRRIKETPISYRPRTYEEGKKIKAIDGAKGLAVILLVRIKLI